MNLELSFIIPTYNEIGNISECLKEIKDTFSKVDYEIVIVDDNSNDGTLEFLKKVSSKDKRIRLFVRKNAWGFGSAIMYGIRRAKGEYAMPFMGDLSDKPSDAMKLLLEIRKGYDIVFTNRFKGKNRAYDYPLFKYYSNRIYNNLISLLIGIPYNDTSNAFKIFRKDILDKVKIKNSGFEFTTELAIKAYLKGDKFSEVPVSWYNRKEGKQKSNLIKIGIGYFRVLFMVLSEKFKK